MSTSPTFKVAFLVGAGARYSGIVGRAFGLIFSTPYLFPEFIKSDPEKDILLGMAHNKKNKF